MHSVVIVHAVIRQVVDCTDVGEWLYC